MPTTVWDRTSRQFSGIPTLSMSPRWAALHITAHSTRSSGSKTRSLPLATLPKLCPLLPILWSPLATDFGEPIWHTRSTDPMSMPSSSDVDETTHLISPRFRRSSTSSLISLPRELWWTSMLSSPRSFSL